MDDSLQLFVRRGWSYCVTNISSAKIVRKPLCWRADLYSNCIIAVLFAMALVSSLGDFSHPRDCAAGFHFYDVNNRISFYGT